MAYNPYMSLFPKKRCSEPVFTGDALEADLVANLLRAEGFNVLVQNQVPRPYGLIGIGRVMVPCDDREAAVAFLESLHEEEPEEENED